MLTTSTEIDQIATALAKAQGQMENASKDRTNPAFKSKYADLASVRDAVTGPLSANGIALVQAPRTIEAGVEVETRLIHTSGQWLACTVSAAPKAFDPQSVGSCTTFLRRYGAMAICNLAPDDDDGNAASGRQDAPQHYQRREEPRREPEPQRAATPAPAAKWSDADRKRFCADVAKFGWSYDHIATYCESKGRPRPSGMAPDQRSALLAALMRPDIRAEVNSLVNTLENV